VSFFVYLNIFGNQIKKKIEIYKYIYK